MQGWLIRWICNIFAIILTAYIIPGFELTIWGAIVGSIFLGVINAVIRPLLLLLTLPLNVLTLGLFTFIINGLCSTLHPRPSKVLRFMASGGLF
jgi:putative membrane protein